MEMRTIIILTFLGLSSTIVYGAKDETDTPKSPTTTADRPTVEATDPDAFCPMPDIADSVDWSHDVEPFEVGRSLILKCKNESETLRGPSTIKCIDPGTWDWDEGKINCIYIECDALEEPHNCSLKLSSDILLPGSTAQYTCDNGFVIVGNSKMTCMASGQWTGNPPICVEECKTEVIPNGVLNPRCTYKDCNAWISCNEGFFVTGKNKLICLSGGKWEAEDGPTCTAITCSPPSQTERGTFCTEPLPNSDHQYVYHTLAMYACLNENDILEGPHNLTCTNTGEWSGDAPVCLDKSNDTTQLQEASTESYENTEAIITSVPARKCSSLENVPFASYAVTNGSRLVIYTCNHGYVLHGNAHRDCLSNGTWSGDSPICMPIRMDQIKWKTIFEDNKEWKGSYLYKNMRIGFKFWYLGMSDSSIQTLLLDDLNAKLDLKGEHLGDAIVFETTRLLVPSDILHDTDWRVRGELTNDTQGWKFTGTVRSAEKGYSTLNMRPVKLVDYEPPPVPAHHEYASATSLALGIAIAVMAIIVAALLAAYCVKRKGGFKGTGHRTLTSFENPVYEYENNVSVKVI